MSSEQFSERLKSDAETSRFYDLVSPVFSKITILCWLREQCEMAVSLYSTAMRTGSTLNFEDYLEKCHPDNTRYNYYKMLNRWSSVFGAGSIEVKVFSKSVFVEGDLICDYLSCISSDLIDVVDRNISSQNVSINAFGQRLLLMTNRLFQRHAKGWLRNKQSLRRGIMKGIESCFPGQGFTPSASDYQRIYDSFFESNRMLNKKYLGKDRALFDFAPPLK